MNVFLKRVALIERGRNRFRRLQNPEKLSSQKSPSWPQVNNEQGTSGQVYVPGKPTVFKTNVHNKISQQISELAYAHTHACTHTDPRLDMPSHLLPSSL